MYKVVKYFPKLDFFGVNIQFNLNHKTKYQTFFGAIVSVSIIAVLLALTFNKLEQIMSYSNPSLTIIQDTNFNDNSQMTYRIPEDFYFGLKLKDQELFSKKQILNFTISQQHQNTSLENTESVQLRLQECNIENWQNVQGFNYSQQMKGMNISQYYCPTEGQEFTIYGSKNTPIFDYIKIEIQQCTDTTKCASQDEVQALLQQQGYFSINFIFANGYFNPLKNPPMEFFITNDIYFNIQPSILYGESDVFIKQNLVLEDRSIIPFRPNMIKYQQSTVGVEDVRTRVLNYFGSDIYYKIFLRQHPYIQSYQKNYQGIDYYLSYIGGLIKVIMLIASLFVFIYNRYSFMIFLANQVYIFDIEQNDGTPSYVEAITQIQQKIEAIKQSKRKVTNSARKVISMLSTKFNTQKLQTRSASPNLTQLIKDKQQLDQPQGDDIPTFSSPNQEEVPMNSQNNVPFYLEYKSKSEFLDKIIEDFVKYHKILQISYLYVIHRITCRKFFSKNKNIMLMDKGITTIKKDLDIKHLLLKLQEIDKLKKVLLTSDQLQLFNYSPKHVIHNYKRIPKNLPQKTFIDKLFEIFDESHYEQKKREILKLEKVYEDIQLIDTSKHNVINEKLLSMIGEDLKDIFEAAHYIDTQSRLHHNKSMLLE